MKEFKKIYDEYVDYAFRLSLSIVKDKEAVNDVMQEAFIRTFKHLESFDETKPFKPWFTRILLNECYRYLEKQKKVITLDFDEGSHSTKKEPAFDDYDELETAIASLEDEQRIPLVLKYMDQLSNEEIANLLNLNVNTVKSRLFKARIKLHEFLTTTYEHWRD